MTILRREKRRAQPFSMIDNRIINNDKLSMEALGLLVYLLSKPDDWEVHLNQLAARFDCGREKMRGVINALIAVGHIRSELKRRTDGGQFEGHGYIVVEDPVEMAETLPLDGKAVRRENRPPGNHPLLSTDLSPRTDSNQKSKSPASLKRSAAFEDSAGRLMTAVEEFWSLKDEAAKVAITDRIMGMLLAACDNDHAAAIRGLRLALRKVEPLAYVAKIINNLNKGRYLLSATTAAVH